MRRGRNAGNEILAHAAARTNLPFAANCSEVKPGDDFIVTRLRWGGSLLEQAELSGTTKLLTIAPNSVPVATAAPVATSPRVDITVQRFAPPLSENDLRVRVTSRVESATGKVSLAGARSWAGGGGAGSAAPKAFESSRNWQTCWAGRWAARAWSRVWAGGPHHDQIGQTGTRIAPELYISCGVSGAIQHMVGAKAAKHILAINTDPEAPIMSKADYVVIGDLHQVVPAIIAEIKRRRG